MSRARAKGPRSFVSQRQRRARAVEEALRHPPVETFLGVDWGAPGGDATAVTEVHKEGAIGHVVGTTFYRNTEKP